MKKLFYILIAVLFVFGMANAGVVNVTSPAAGSQWCINQPANPVIITWSETPKDHQNVKIRLFDHTMANQILKITDNTPNDGSYNWVIPANIPPGQYRIRVKSTDDQASGNSAIFSISDCSPPDDPEATGTMTIERPKQGDYLIAGGSFDIKWRADGYVPNKCVNLYLLIRNQQEMQIAQNRCVNGFHWNIPANLSGTDYKIRLRTTDSQIHDDSDNFPILSSLPDLVIGGKMTRTPKHPKVDEFFDFKFRVDNAGKGQAAESDAELTIKGPENFLLVKRISVRSLGGAPDHEYFKKTMRLPGMGIYRFTLKLDVDNDVVEGGETNNEKWILVDVNPKQFPDLKITRVSTPDYKKTIQQKCTMYVRVTNSGQAPSGYFELDADLDTCPLIAQGRKYRTHQGLAPGESVTFKFTHKYACFKMVGVDFHVDKADNVKESNENNNTCGLPFHISGDNIVGKKKPWWSNCSN